jgi:TctA family transporter
MLFSGGDLRIFFSNGLVATLMALAILLLLVPVFLHLRTQKWWPLGPRVDAA